jgi:hypothetical protein
MFKIIGEVNQIVSNYNSQSLEIIDGLNFKQSHTLRMIEFYSNSKYILGQHDELGKEKPFYNIVNGMCDVENAAVDIDTKDIKTTADEPQDYDKSFLLTIELQEWMKEADFACTLNEIRDTRTRYGGVVAKKCVEMDEDEGKKILTIEVPEWKNLITDPVNLLEGVIIEKHYMSPAELSKKAGVWDNVPEAMKLASKLRLSKGFANQQASNKKIPIYEVRGEFTQAFYKEAMGKPVSEGDDSKYSYQLYIIAGEQAGKQFILYCEDDTEKVYKYLARKKKPGRALGMGVVEEGEQTQIWTNDTVQKQQRAFEITSKPIGQSASRRLKGRNLLTETEAGTILEHDDGKPVTPLNMIPAGGMQQFDSLVELWFAQYEKATSGYAMQRGQVTTKNFRLQSAALQQSGSVFDFIREEMGIFIGEIFYDWILPYLSTQINKVHILGHEFSPDELKTLDNNYSQHVANQQVIEQILSGKLATTEEYDAFKQFALQNIQKTKAHRFMDIPKGYYKDLEAKITIDITGEQRNKTAALEALNNILSIVGQNPTILQDPVASQVFMKIIELSDAGISPIALVAGIQEQAKQMQDQQKSGGGKVSESISFKDLPPDGQVQMAQQAGIKIAQGAPQPQPGQQPQQPQGQPAPQQKQLSLTATGGR